MKEKIENNLALVIVFVFLAIFGGIAFMRTPDSVEILDEYNQITSTDEDEGEEDEAEIRPDASEEEQSSEVDAKKATETQTVESSSVVISSMNVIDNSLSVRGYVTGTIENGGTCLFELKSSNGTLVDSVSRTGVASAQNTSCGLAELDASGLSGQYVVHLTYSSTNNSIERTSQNIEI